MTNSEKKAVLQYLEFGLLNFCDQLDPHTSPDGIGLLYEEAYMMLIDMEHTLDTHIMMTKKQHP